MWFIFFAPNCFCKSYINCRKNKNPAPPQRQTKFVVGYKLLLVTFFFRYLFLLYRDTPSVMVPVLKTIGHPWLPGLCILVGGRQCPVKVFWIYPYAFVPVCILGLSSGFCWVLAGIQVWEQRPIEADVWELTFSFLCIVCLVYYDNGSCLVSLLNYNVWIIFHTAHGILLHTAEAGSGAGFFCWLFQLQLGSRNILHIGPVCCCGLQGESTWIPSFCNVMYEPIGHPYSVHWWKGA